MITARHFEDQMIELIEEYKDKPETMTDLMARLMADTLDCLGYAAGTKIFRERMNYAEQK